MECCGTTKESRGGTNPAAASKCHAVPGCKRPVEDRCEKERSIGSCKHAPLVIDVHTGFWSAGEQLAGTTGGHVRDPVNDIASRMIASHSGESVPRGSEVSLVPSRTPVTSADETETYRRNWDHSPKIDDRREGWPKLHGASVSGTFALAENPLLVARFPGTDAETSAKGHQLPLD